MAAPLLHVSVFGIASLLLLFSDKPVLQGPAYLPVLILWIADIPISLVASGRLFFRDEYAKLV